MGINVIMRVQTIEANTEAGIRQLSADLAEAFGTARFDIYLPEVDGGSGQHALTYEGPREFSVNFSSRFYSPTYPRGDFATIFAVVEWLRYRLPLCTILYGGDTGLPLEEFSLSYGDRVWEYFVKFGHTEYYIPATESPLCSFCGNRPMVEYGFSEDAIKYH